MQEHPLLMQGPLVRAILEGRKTQTRRLINPQPGDDIENVKYDDVADLWLGSNKEDNDLGYCFSWTARSPLGRAGDRLWVRETWTAAMHEPKGPADCLYRADDNRGVEDLAEAKWTPSIHMPRWACRLVLPQVSVRVERVQDITEEDAKAEGVEPIGGSYREGFRSVMQAIYGKECWDANWWVWVAEWKEIEVSR